MKKSNKHQVLRLELQAIAQLTGQLAEHLLKATGLMCFMGGIPINVALNENVLLEATHAPKK